MENQSLTSVVYKVNFEKNNIGNPISDDEANRLGKEYIDKTPVLILTYKMSSKGKAIGIIGLWSTPKILEYTWLYDDIYLLSPNNINNVYVEGVKLDNVAKNTSLIRIITPKMTYGEAITLNRYLEETINGITITKALTSKLTGDLGIDQLEAYIPLIHYGCKKGNGYKINTAEYNDPDLSIDEYVISSNPDIYTALPEITNDDILKLNNLYDGLLDKSLLIKTLKKVPYYAYYALRSNNLHHKLIDFINYYIREEDRLFHDEIKLPMQFKDTKIAINLDILDKSLPFNSSTRALSMLKEQVGIDVTKLSDVVLTGDIVTSAVMHCSKSINYQTVYPPNYLVVLESHDTIYDKPVIKNVHFDNNILSITKGKNKLQYDSYKLMGNTLNVLVNEKNKTKVIDNIKKLGKFKHLNSESTTKYLSDQYPYFMPEYDNINPEFGELLISDNVYIRILTVSNPIEHIISAPLGSGRLGYENGKFYLFPSAVKYSIYKGDGDLHPVRTSDRFNITDTILIDRQRGFKYTGHVLHDDLAGYIANNSAWMKMFMSDDEKMTIYSNGKQNSMLQGFLNYDVIVS